MNEKSALVTVTSDNYIVATDVWLYSVLRIHPDFDKDIIVIIDELSEAARQRLLRHYPVRFLVRDRLLESKIATLRQSVPTLRPDLHHRLLSLELFRLEDYDSIVFLDSDGICVGPLDELFALGDIGLAAVDDGFTYEDNTAALLGSVGLAPLGGAGRYGRSNLRETFNAGAMVVSARYLHAAVHREIAALLDDIPLWRSAGAQGFTDQMVLNLFFQGQRQRLHGRYNLMPFIEAYQRHVDGLQLTDARFVHYAGRIKPWFDYDPAAIVRLAPHYLPYLRIWRDLWESMRCRDDAGLRAGQIVAQHAWTESGKDAQLCRLGTALDPGTGGAS